MTRKEQIIKEREEFYGVELDANFDAGVNGLCEDIHCPNPECSCWQEFTAAVDAELQWLANPTLKNYQEIVQLSKTKNADVPCQHKDTRGGECLRCGKAVVTKSVLQHYQELERQSRPMEVA